MFGQGQNLDIAGMSVIAHYKKNSEQVSDMSALQITGYNKNNPGTQTVTVTMKKASATFTVTVVPVESITVLQTGTTSFKQGDAANWGGLSVRVRFENDAVPEEIVSASNSALAISGYDKDRAGEQQITVDYYGKRTAFTVTVVGLESISVATLPSQTEYYTGEELDISGLVVRGTWSDGSAAQINITKDNLSGYDITRGGQQTVTVSYSGKTTSFPITYLAFEAVSIDRAPTKTVYEMGEELDTQGLRVLGTWPGHSLAMVNNARLRITGYDPLRAGEQRVTVTVGGQSDSFTVTVTNPFEGIWRGEWKAGSIQVDGERKTHMAPVTLTLEGSAWILRTQEIKGGKVEPLELRGVYTPDSGTHAKLQCDNYRGNGQITRDSANVMRLNITLTGQITLDRAGLGPGGDGPRPLVDIRSGG
jgi:uncharacterized protein YkuJ